MIEFAVSYPSIEHSVKSMVSTESEKSILAFGSLIDAISYSDDVDDPYRRTGLGTFVDENTEFDLNDDDEDDNADDELNRLAIPGIFVDESR